MLTWRCRKNRFLYFQNCHAILRDRFIILNTGILMKKIWVAGKSGGYHNTHLGLKSSAVVHGFCIFTKPHSFAKLIYVHSETFSRSKRAELGITMFFTYSFETLRTAAWVNHRYRTCPGRAGSARLVVGTPSLPAMTSATSIRYVLAPRERNQLLTTGSCSRFSGSTVANTWDILR